MHRRPKREKIRGKVPRLFTLWRFKHPFLFWRTGDRRCDPFGKNPNRLSPISAKRTNNACFEYPSCRKGRGWVAIIAKHLSQPVCFISCQNVTPASATSDRVCYYYATYKPTHAESFLPLGETGESYYRNQLTKGYEDYFVEEGYPFLNEYQAKTLDEGLRNADYSLGTEIKNQLASRYVKLLQNGAKEFESSYAPYLEKNQEYEKGISTYLQIQATTVLLSCLLASLLYFGLSPWIFQNGQTPADKSFQLYYEDQGLEPGVRFHLFRLLFGVIDFGLLIPFALLLSSGAAGLEILAQGKVGYLPLWVCPLISFSWVGFRYLFSLIRKDHITFLEWAGKAREVDGRSVEINRSSK